MKLHIEAWARYCATHKYSARQTLEKAIANRRAVLSAISQGVKCEVCGGWLQLGYKVQLPIDNGRTYETGYIHTKPEWCARATEANNLMQAVQDAFESVDKELRDGTTFPNTLLAVSARIALAWMDIDKEART